MAVATEGLFRKPGNIQRCRKLRVELDSGQEIIVTDGDEDELGDIRPHDIAALLKEYFRLGVLQYCVKFLFAGFILLFFAYFRDLPYPLMTAEMYPVCVSLGR